MFKDDFGYSKIYLSGIVLIIISGNVTDDSLWIFLEEVYFFKLDSDAVLFSNYNLELVPNKTAQIFL